MPELNILVVDDDNLQRKGLFDLLSRWGHNTQACDCLSDAAALMEKNTFDLILLDMKLPDGNGLEFLDQQKQNDPSINVVIITAYADVATAVAAIKCGAFDYLPKPFEYEQLEKIIRNAAEKVKLSNKISALSQLASAGGGDVWEQGDLIVRTESARKVFETAERIAKAPDTTVLILGESGTGKGMMAKMIHHLSPRSSNPFIDINCSAIPEQLMESEIFGYEKGAFTDAKNRKIGLLEAADGGSVFLDEIGDMSINLQGKLLKVIEEKEFRRLGSARSTHVDIRVIAATSRDLQARIKEGLFREDLYYRLSVVPIVMPPLRERKDCIPAIAEHYLKLNAKKMNRKITGFDEETTRIMADYEWPGNVRELCNLVERSVILSQSDTIKPVDIGLNTGSESVQNSPAESSVEIPSGNGDGITPMSLAECEKKLITSVLASVDNNRSKAAEILNIHRTTLYKKIEEYKL